ncbi:MAG: BamA/TamA family outer membrane protein [Clostridium sp.]|nr:BamA/TamA family outer membrane protein [Clostridium sp.]
MNRTTTSKQSRGPVSATALTAMLLLAAVAGALLCSSCSTTRRIPADEILYTGVKDVRVVLPEGEKAAPGLDGDLNNAVKVKPNNPLLGSAKYRIPFPLGLWVYNNWPNPPSGFKHWIFEKLSTEPVLVSDVRPEVRVHMLDEILQNHGYFRGSASYTLAQGKNKKKASIIYEINTGTPYPIDSVILLPDTCHLNHMIDSLAAAGSYLKPGVRYSTDSLSAERIRITNYVRNHGYYFFKPEYIEYLADSTINPGHIAMKVMIAEGLPAPALWRYRTGSITTRVNRNNGHGYPDTIETRRGTLIQMKPSRLRKGLIPGCITFRDGKIFSVRDMNNTQSNLARLGIFNGIDIEATLDTAALRRGEHLLDVNIDCTFDKPIEASLELNLSSKSNSYIGPGLNVALTNRNIFGGGELFTVGLNGSYEWQTGRDSRSVFNSYEAGITTTLAFPRLLAPAFFKRSRRTLNWTRASLNADLLNRPHYFKMAQFNASFGYDWRATRHVNMNWTVFKLTYTKLMKTTAEFDSIMNANKAIALSFRNQFIPQMQYTYLYDRQFGYDNTLNFQFTVQEAGNLFWAIYTACGKKGEKELFNTPFSQFIKGSAQIVYGRRISGDNWIYTRVAAGAAHAYGNSSQVPYSEQFYVGGANSVRAFTVRSIGPGSYHVPDDQVNGYFDQTGTFKFEANIEYRFPIFGPLHGALFVDAGNVWLLKKDPNRPGGLLRASTFWRDLALGTGAGLRFDLGMMVIRGDLGIGIHAPYDTGKRGYYNMKSFGKSLAFHLAIGYPF